MVMESEVDEVDEVGMVGLKIVLLVFSYKMIHFPPHPAST